MVSSLLSSDIALFAFSRERQATMVWKFSEAWAITLAVAKPTPEFAPVFLLAMVLSSSHVRRTGDKNDSWRHFYC